MYLKCILLSLFLITSSYANEFIDENNFKITSFTVEEIAEENKNVLPPYSSGNKNVLRDIVLVVDTLIAVGKKVYAVVEAGRPVVNTKYNNVSVLPKTEDGNVVDAFYYMEGWSRPVHKKYKITYKNFYGVEVVSFTYGASMQYGGKYNGVGSYILGANIYADNLNVLWGWNLDASIQTVTISNVGNLDDPVGSLQLQLDVKVSTPINENNYSHVFHFSGKGQLTSNK